MLSAVFGQFQDNDGQDGYETFILACSIVNE